ncbi:MFS general substrate transporter [Tothia fuscella]|uniref:MFS general substrate transporter n=1 Tax=Tothia fuscella TaxID=1048955 RepID=A0A9P4U429_9PEZI|nr:MFS general substrate transporter [Tothia fuscella]
METAAQVDLARTEAPADEVIASALGQGLLHLNPVSTSSTNNGGPQLHKLNSRGSSAITTQVRLGPKGQSQQFEIDDDSRLNSSDFGESGQGSVFTLQPVDEGFGAWSYVASAFAMYIVVWGFPQAFPIFQTYLSSGSKAKFPDSMILPLLAPGIQDIQEGIMFQFLPRFAHHPRMIVIGGIAIMILSIFLASCATTSWQVVVSQGILFGIGGIMLNFVHVSAFSEWFDKKQSQAMGIVWLGYRFGALAFPLICQWLLDNHGYEKTLRILVAPMLALLLPSIFLLRGRYPVAAVKVVSVNPPVSKLAALRTPKVAFYLLVSTTWNLIVFVPLTFITKVGADIGVSRADQALAQSLLILSLMLGTYGLAKMSDDGFHPRFLSYSAMATSFAHILLLGFCKNRFTLFAYAVSVGLASGGFDNSLFSFYGEVSGKNSELFTSVHSLFSFCRGLATLSVGSVGMALIRRSPPINLSSYAIAKYQYLVVYAGGMSALTSVLVVLYTSLDHKQASPAPQPHVAGSNEHEEL